MLNSKEKIQSILLGMLIQYNRSVLYDRDGTAHVVEFINVFKCPSLVFTTYLICLHLIRNLVMIKYKTCLNEHNMF